MLDFNPLSIGYLDLQGSFLKGKENIVVNSISRVHILFSFLTKRYWRLKGWPFTLNPPPWKHLFKD